MSEETEDQLPRRIAAKDRLVELLDEATVRLEGVYEDRLIGLGLLPSSHRAPHCKARIAKPATWDHGFTLDGARS